MEEKKETIDKINATDFNNKDTIINKNIITASLMDFNPNYSDKVYKLIDCNFSLAYISIKGHFSFSGCSIDNCTLEPIDERSSITFENCNFNNINLKYNNKARFIKCKFENITFDSNHQVVILSNYFYLCDINKASTKRDQNFQKLYFEECSFKDIESLSYINFQDKTNLFNCSFNQNYPPEIYRKLKKNFHDLKNDTLTDTFGFLENKASYKKQPIFSKINFSKNLIDKIFGWFYWLINDFGLEPYLPLVWLISISEALIICDNLSSDTTKHSIINGFIFLINPLTILHGKTYNFIGYSKEYSLFLTTLSSLLWFFLIIGIRKRYKIDK